MISGELNRRGSVNSWGPLPLMSIKNIDGVGRSENHTLSSVLSSQTSGTPILKGAFDKRGLVGSIGAPNENCRRCPKRETKENLGCMDGRNE